MNHREVRSHTRVPVERIRTCARNRGRQRDYSSPRGTRIRTGEWCCNRFRRRPARSMAMSTRILPAALPFGPKSAARRSYWGKPRSASHIGRHRFAGNPPGHRRCRRRTRKWASQASAHTRRSCIWKRLPLANLARTRQAVSPTLPCPSFLLRPARMRRPVHSSASSGGRLIAEIPTSSPVRILRMGLNRCSA